jgi:hypothetical protein
MWEIHGTYGVTVKNKDEFYWGPVRDVLNQDPDGWEYHLVSVVRAREAEFIYPYTRYQIDI